MFKRNSDERRKAPRRRVLFGSRLASIEGGQYLRCTTRDISSAGARVHIDGQQFSLDRAFYLDLRSQLAYEARVVWNKSPELGLQFIRTYRFDEIPSPAISKHIAAEFLN